MTLLIAARAKSHILVTADGLSMLTSDGERAILSNTLQKIFPVDGRPLALIHHGENVIDNRPISELVFSFVRDNGLIAAKCTRDVSFLLANKLDTLVTATLTRVVDSKVCGFWVCGFDTDLPNPQIYELNWYKNTSTQIERKLAQHGDLLMGGDGAQFIKTYLSAPINEYLSWDRIFNSDLQYSIRLHSELFRRAELTQETGCNVLFGGHTHQLVITKEGCKWLVEPKH
jgi:hypothetical protein